ncbi:MAG: type II toxin-antitoxin system VapB family antitoxin [Pseudomonadota bacterium]
MGLNIKNAEVEQKIRRLAEIDQTSLTDAVDRAVDEALRLRDAKCEEYSHEVELFLDELRSLQPLPAGVSSDHSDMYDEHGLPLW